MDTRSEIREFLTSRRAKLTPDQAERAAYGSRRVPGLRREEVAVLAGVSVPYYTRLERGDISGVSEGVLEALARALQLDDAERAHLFDLARTAGPMANSRRRSAPKQIRPSVQRLLDAITGAPALVQNGRLDILAANQLARALYSELFRDPTQPPQPRPLQLPEPQRARPLPRLGTRRQRRRRTATSRGWPRPIRPRADRPHRRALHPQRRALEDDGWVRERGGKHQVKMVKPGKRPITLPQHKGRT